MACLRFGFTTAFNYVSGPPANVAAMPPLPGSLASSGQALVQRQGAGRRICPSAALTPLGAFV